MRRLFLHFNADVALATIYIFYPVTTTSNRIIFVLYISLAHVLELYHEDCCLEMVTQIKYKNSRQLHICIPQFKQILEASDSTMADTNSLFTCKN